VQERLLANR